ncbi:uncharacterized protein LOC123689195 [Pieris rapae]|uniref:uncharacterized protein LOC123689195 n=1 Tax=Pieris rapae TaxID=64459 RepID=UPI001E27CF13|nr:uncharacterized protein LOC123689195 [Pieris rapae]
MKESSTRRKNVGYDKTELSSLHIEYNQPQDYEHHIAENKIDSPPHSNVKSSLSNKDQIRNVMGNYSQATKDQNLSKIVVNELKKGKEIIGDKNVIPMSNITFTPENDTLTAMAFIAGNLLNKLWNMDKVSSESFESDSLKHQKINDLLELFKEPLNARQEMFLKNALEKLSHSLNKNKNMRNITICETLETEDLENKSSNTIFDVNNKCNKSKTSKSTENNFNKPKNTDSKTIDHSDVAEKLTDVLNLINKFDNTHRELNSLREKVDSASKQSSDENLSDNNNNKFNLFGKVLEKVTKLLLPYRHSKRMINKINKLHQLKDAQQLKGNVFGSLSISAKDTIILDYLNHIKNNPNCLLRKLAANPEIFDEDLIGIKGNVIESITKLLNGKSLIDIQKLIVPQKTTLGTSTTTQPTTTKGFQQLRKSKELEPVKLTSAKERLKTHLQSIIYDLVELQNERGNHGTEINITDILPCISHLIGNNNKNKESLEMSPTKKNNGLPIDNIEKLIDALQVEFRSTSFTRRSDVGERSTSARVWERILKNIDFNRNKSRRFQLDKSKSYSDLKKSIENIEKLSGTYKNYALLSVIPAYKKRMLLKTLQADVTRHSNVLAEIQSSFSSLKQISPENLKDVVEFIDNTATNIKLSNNVLRNINKTNYKMQKPFPKLLELKSERTPLIQNYIKQQNNRNIKLTREQIMNQLMLNRIQLYLKMKEEDGLKENDLNYNIGKRALEALRNGNSRLAKELYQILVESKLVRNIPQARRMGK